MQVALALLSTAVAGIFGVKALVSETGNQVNRTAPALVALAVAGATFYLVWKKVGK